MTIARTTTYAVGQVIDPVVHNTEHDDFVSACNTNETNVTNILSGTTTFNGAKTFASQTTFSGGLKSNTISEVTPAAGVTIDSTLLKDGMVTVSGIPAANGTIGYDSGNLMGYASGASFNIAPPFLGVTARSSNTILAGADSGKAFAFTGTFTQTLTAAATLGNRWFCYFRNEGSGVITFDANGSETLNGTTTLAIPPGMAGILFCDGTNFKAILTRPHYIYLRDEKASGTDGGASTAGSYQTRTLNTKVTDETGLVTLAANQFALPIGTYQIRARSPHFAADSFKIKLRNVTDGSDTIIGSSGNCGAAENVQVDAWLSGTFTITAAKTFELQYRITTASAGGTTNQGLGWASSFGTEVYAEVELWKVA